MRSQLIVLRLFCLVVVGVIIIDVVYVVVVVPNVDVVVQATSKVDLRLFVMEVEFHGGWVVVCKAIFMSNPT